MRPRLAFLAATMALMANSAGTTDIEAFELEPVVPEPPPRVEYAPGDGGNRKHRRAAKAEARRTARRRR